MFRISHVLGTHREHDRRAIAEVQTLLVAAFPDLADVPDYVERKLALQTTRNYPTILLTAHGPGDKVMGFALADHFEWLGYAYLDFNRHPGRAARSRARRWPLRSLAAGHGRQGSEGAFFSKSPPMTPRRWPTRSI